jgi:murein DD-endopeptidase MepM/ murein hydrolase activator NlpD
LLWTIGTMGTLACASAAAETMTAAQCKKQYANDPAAQLACARNAFAPPSAPTAEAEVQTPSPLTTPLVNMQLIFGFFDRRFPGFNNGLEHLGADFAAAAGTTVAAICDGTVVFNNTSQAPVAAVVMVEHDCPQPLGMVYGYYGHVQSDLLTGENITAGGNIGTVREWPGNSHLHLGLSTRLYEADWGVVPRGATLPELETQGWLNPLIYFTGAQPRQAGGSEVQPAAKRAPVPNTVPPKPAAKPAPVWVKPKRTP